MKAGNNGVTQNTMKRIQFGAGTIHRDLKFNESTGWNFEETCIGATKGGSSVKITPEIYTVRPDGATVAIKDFKLKTGETAIMEINLLELNEDVVKMALIANKNVSSVPNAHFTKFTSKDRIEEGDYWENIAFVGETVEGKAIIVILPNAMCTSGLTIEGKSSEESVGKYTFECHADASTSLTKLPYEVYFPNDLVTPLND